MEFIDSHSHIYSSQFDEDRTQVVENALQQGVKKIFLPNIDQESIEPMLNLCDQFPEVCYPMMGLHPTSVNNDFEKELEIVDNWFEKKKFIAVGECGIDLYWDKTFFEQQKIVFAHQIKLAVKHNLPIVIHARDSFKEIFEVLEKNWDSSLKGVFHSFTGNMNDLNKINEFNFMIGINGIVTFKNSDLKDVVKHIELEKLLLETDSPYLSPVPKRGKRNESAYLFHVAVKIAEVFGIELEEISKITTKNALALFGVK